MLESTPPAVVDLLTWTAMSAPSGMVYSTSPLSAVDRQGGDWVVKGRGDVDIIFSEAVAYQICSLLGIPTPDYALARFPNGDLSFASQKLASAGRAVDPFFVQRRVVNAETITRLVLVDVWIANNDRNHGSLLAESEDGGARIYAIDFEKAAALRSPHPLMQSAAVTPSDCLPSPSLRGLLRATVPAPNSTHFDSILAIPDEQLEVIVTTTATAIGIVDSWPESSASALLARRGRLSQWVNTWL